MLRPCTTVQRYLRLFAGLEVLDPSPEGSAGLVPRLYLLDLRGRVRSLADPCDDFIHGVVNELLPKLSQDVGF